MSDRTNRADHASVGDLDDRLKRVDEPRWIASRYAAADDRRRLVALYMLNHELSRAAQVSEPMIGSIRLQWWREALAELGEGRPVRRHDVLMELQTVLGDRSDLRRALDVLVDHWQQRVDGEKVAGRQDDTAMTQLAVQALIGEEAVMGHHDLRAALETGAFSTDLTQMEQKAWPALVHRAAFDNEGRKVSGVRARWRILKAMLTGRIG